jgi:hypothetical protein
MERFASDTMSRAGNSYNAMNTFRGSISRFVGNLNNHAAPRFRLARSKFTLNRLTFYLIIVCPGWVIGNLEALAGAKPGHILAGMYSFVLIFSVKLKLTHCYSLFLFDDSYQLPASLYFVRKS